MRKDWPHPWSRRFDGGAVERRSGRAARPSLSTHWRTSMRYGRLRSAAGASRSVRHWNVERGAEPGLEQVGDLAQLARVVSPPAESS